MNALQAKPFPTLDAAELEAWAIERGRAIDLIVAQAFHPAVLDNLAVLQIHAARMAEAMDRAEAEGAARAAEA